MYKKERKTRLEDAKKRKKPLFTEEEEQLVSRALGRRASEESLGMCFVHLAHPHKANQPTNSLAAGGKPTQQSKSWEARVNEKKLEVEAAGQTADSLLVATDLLKKIHEDQRNETPETEGGGANDREKTVVPEPQGGKPHRRRRKQKGTASGEQSEEVEVPLDPPPARTGRTTKKTNACMCSYSAHAYGPTNEHDLPFTDTKDFDTENGWDPKTKPFVIPDGLSDESKKVRMSREFLPHHSSASLI